MATTAEFDTRKTIAEVNSPALSGTTGTRSTPEPISVPEGRSLNAFPELITTPRLTATPGVGGNNKEVMPKANVYTPAVEANPNMKVISDVTALAPSYQSSAARAATLKINASATLGANGTFSEVENIPDQVKQTPETDTKSTARANCSKTATGGESTPKQEAQATIINHESFSISEAKWAKATARAEPRPTAEAEIIPNQKHSSTARSTRRKSNPHTRPTTETTLRVKTKPTAGVEITPQKAKFTRRKEHSLYAKPSTGSETAPQTTYTLREKATPKAGAKPTTCTVSETASQGKHRYPPEGKATPKAKATTGEQITPTRKAKSGGKCAKPSADIDTTSEAQPTCEACISKVKSTVGTKSTLKRTLVAKQSQNPKTKFSSVRVKTASETNSTSVAESTPKAKVTATIATPSSSPRQIEIDDFERSIKEKKSYYVEKHRQKLQNLYQARANMQRPQKCSLSEVDQRMEKMKREKSAVDNQIQECFAQEEEFVSYCECLQRKLSHLKLSGNTSLLKKWRIEFGQECNRYHKALPIYAKRREIIETISQNQVTVLIGETGSGKSTQIVQYLFDASFGKSGLIACTQPRKIAAASLASFVSTEMGKRTVKRYTGLQSKNVKEAKVLYMTDHILLNECIADPNLSKYSCLIVDEAHERSIPTDLLLAFIKQCLPRRRDLKVIVTSATINPDLFIQYFGCCPVVTVPGRAFPVDVIWNPLKATEPPSSRNYVSDAIKVVKMIHCQEAEQGDILVFLTNPIEIERACHKASIELGNAAVVLPLHGKLQPEDQRKVFNDYPGKQKVIFATNVAETSVTISGVKYIVDTGLAKELCFDPKRSMNSLEVRLISKSSAEQRKGRAGRTSAGKCFRLYSKEVYQGMPERMLPEILRVHLSHAVLKLYEFGISNILAFDFVEHPDQAALKTAVEMLQFLKAVKEGKLTDLGRKMATLPLEPQLAKVLLDGIQAGIGLEAAIAVSISGLGGSIFFRGGTDEMKVASDRKKVEFCHPAGDQMTYLCAYQQWKSQEKNERNQWCVDNYINAKSMRITDETVRELQEILYRNLRISLPCQIAKINDAENKLPKLFFEAFIHNISIFLGHERAGYMTEKLSKESVIIFPGSTLCQLNLTPMYVVYEKVLKTSQQFMIQVLPVEEEWVQKAISDQQIPYDPAEKFKEHMVSPMTIANIGHYILKEAILKNCQKVKKELKDVCEGTPLALDILQELGKLKVYTQSRYHQEAQRLIEGHLSSVREIFKKKQFEWGVTKKEDDVRLVIGLGGEVQHVLMPYHYRHVVAKGPPDQNWTEDVLTSLTQFGEIDYSEIKVFSKECRMFVTFRNPNDASQAVTMLEAPEGIVIMPQSRRKNNETEFTLRIEWCRRRRTNWAFVEFNSADDLSTAKRRLECSHIVIGGQFVKFRPSRDEKIQLFVMNVGVPVTAEALTDEIRLNLPIGMDFKVKLGFEKAFETTPEKLDALKHQLQTLVANYATQGQFTVNMCDCKPQYVTFRTYVNFRNPAEGHAVITHLAGESLEGNVLEIQPLYSSSVRYSPKVYHVLKDTVNKIKFELQQQCENTVKIFERQDKFGNTIIEIKSEDANAFIMAKGVLSAVLQPKVVEYQHTGALRQFAATRQCLQILEEIQLSTETYIFTDQRLMTINIYGAEANKIQAESALKERLDVLKGTSCYELELKAHGRPPGLMKHLVSLFGLDLAGLIKQEGIVGATLDPRRQVLIVLATSDAHSSLLQQMDDYSAKFNISPTQVNDVECCTCFTEIEKVFRLEYCGHPYCLECIELQVSTATFPLQCAAENCSQKFVWQDFENLFKQTSFTLKQLTELSLKSYLNVNGQTVRNCTTPNCSMVYVVSEDGKRFICSHCGIHLCTKCHVQYHDGLTCDMYSSGKNTDKHVLEWCSKNPEKRKQCPNCKVPIEKIAGCDHVLCKCKAHICWKCLEFFDSPGACYGHLDEAHGTFI